MCLCVDGPEKVHAIANRTRDEAKKCQTTPPNSTTCNGNFCCMQPTDLSTKCRRQRANQPSARATWDDHIYQLREHKHADTLLQRIDISWELGGWLVWWWYCWRVYMFWLVDTGERRHTSHWEPPEVLLGQIPSFSIKFFFFCCLLLLSIPLTSAMASRKRTQTLALRYSSAVLYNMSSSCRLSLRRCGANEERRFYIDMSATEIVEFVSGRICVCLWILVSCVHLGHLKVELVNGWRVQ